MDEGGLPMSMIETEETNQFTFEPFAAHPFYQEINHSLVRRAIASLAARTSKATLTIVDMACGTGAITRLLAQEIAYQGRQAHIIGVDPSAEALRRAQRSIQAKEVAGQVEFIQGEANDLPRLIHDADAAFFCNAIHLVPDKLAAFQQVAAILAPRGLFACNSAFYDGTYVEGTERFYRLWTRRAVGWLRKEHPEVQLSRESRATAMQQLDRDGYICQLREGGFSHVDVVEERVIMTVDSYRDIGQYWLFIEGAL